MVSMNQKKKHKNKKAPSILQNFQTEEQKKTLHNVHSLFRNLLFYNDGISDFNKHQTIQVKVDAILFIQ
jgi:hypothetical protein